MSNKVWEIPRFVNFDEHVNNEEHKPRKAYTLRHRLMNSLSMGCRLSEFIKKFHKCIQKPRMHELAKQGGPA